MAEDAFVNSVSEIRSNVDTLTAFATGSPEERLFHRKRIKNGKNFVAVHGATATFSPSKFAGYANNSLEHRDRLRQRDGRKTDLQITNLVGKPLEVGDPGYADVDAQFESYCTAHGITPSRHPRARRYWVI